MSREELLKKIDGCEFFGSKFGGGFGVVVCSEPSVANVSSKPYDYYVVTPYVDEFCWLVDELSGGECNEALLSDLAKLGVNAMYVKPSDGRSYLRTIVNWYFDII